MKKSSFLITVFALSIVPFLAFANKQVIILNDTNVQPGFLSFTKFTVNSQDYNVFSKGYSTSPNFNNYAVISIEDSNINIVLKETVFGNGILNPQQIINCGLHQFLKNENVLVEINSPDPSLNYNSIITCNFIGLS